VTATARLAGLRFEAPIAAPDVWPRMDVAGFCGFASAGPRDTPVAIEDAASFVRVFGDDPVLCVDAAGTPVTSRLGAGVRAFFAQGGRRCHVVGVAPPAAFDATGLADPLLLDATVAALPAAIEAARAPRGLHALAAVEEVSLLALPDASLSGWTSEDAPPPPPPAPSPSLPVESVLFGACDRPPLPRPTLNWLPPDGLAWTAPGGTIFELQIARDPAWADATTLLEGDATRTTLPPATAHRYFRVRAIDGARFGDWSEGVLVPGPATTLQREIPPAFFQDATLLGLHRALLRLAAARGDAVAVMALPRHYDEAATLAHAAVLRAPIGIEPNALGYGALYHPWIAFAGAGDVAPDGPACGAIARRTLDRGAWIAPANIAWPNALALAPRPLRDDRLLALQAARVNVLRRTPRGIMPLAAQTLAIDDDLKPLGVRRLLILLRRIALRDGAALVFEPNGDALRRALERRFESLLAALFARGAFAPARASDAFRVSVDQSRAAVGQLVVELRVAPSRPLAFLTVRLSRTGDRLTTESV